MNNGLPASSLSTTRAHAALADAFNYLYMASARVFVSMNALDQVLWIDEPVTMQNKHTPNESLCRYVATRVSFIIRLPIMSRKLKAVCRCARSHRPESMRRGCERW